MKTRCSASEGPGGHRAHTFCGRGKRVRGNIDAASRAGHTHGKKRAHAQALGRKGDGAGALSRRTQAHGRLPKPSAKGQQKGRFAAASNEPRVGRSAVAATRGGRRVCRLGRRHRQLDHLRLLLAAVASLLERRQRLPRRHRAHLSKRRGEAGAAKAQPRRAGCCSGRTGGWGGARAPWPTAGRAA